MPLISQRKIRAFWGRRGLGNIALLPLSALFYLACALRKAAYRTGLFRTYKAKVPVVIAGGLTAGGGGKTTLTIALVTGLSQLGLKPGVIARGEGRTEGTASLVSAEDDPAQKGDEAVMVAAKTGFPVAVSRKRAQAAQLLLASHPEVNVLVSDDGLQHLALARDFEIVVLTDGYGLGNRWLMPAGPLREGMSRLKTVDAVVRKGEVDNDDEYALSLGPPEILDLNGTAVEAGDLAGRVVTAIAGIAEPEAFFGDLREHGVVPDRCVAFPDHHPYSEQDLADLKTEVLVMTEKDEIKCRRLLDEMILVFKRQPSLDPRLLDKIAACVNEARTA